MDDFKFNKTRWSPESQLIWMLNVTHTTTQDVKQWPTCWVCSKFDLLLVTGISLFTHKFVANVWRVSYVALIAFRQCCQTMEPLSDIVDSLRYSHNHTIHSSYWLTSVFCEKIGWTVQRVYNSNYLFVTIKNVRKT